jgi:hypothetical protein
MGSGEPEVCDQVVGVAGRRLEEIPPLLRIPTKAATYSNRIAATIPI